MTHKILILAVALTIVGGCCAQIYTGPTDQTEASPTTPAAPADAPAQDAFITQTVYGFLDFTTTIANTVMVFSPQSAPPEGNQVTDNTSDPIIKTKPTDAPKKKLDIQPSKTVESDKPAETKERPKSVKSVVNSVSEQATKTTVQKSSQVSKTSESTAIPVIASSITEVQPKEELPKLKNNLAEPEYDFLSKQPSEVVDETYKLINLRPSAKPQAKPRPSQRRDKENPTGLVTKLGGTIVKDDLTTVHETSVIGTYINGKYAQVLQSSSRILRNPEDEPVEERIKPTSTQRILKTIGPQQGKHKQFLEPTPSNGDEEEDYDARANRRSNNVAGRLKFRNKISEDVDSSEFKPSSKNRPTTARPNYKNRVPTTTTETPTRRRPGFKPNNQPSTSKFQKSIKSEQSNPLISSVPKTKLPRTQGRWSYKTTPKPRINIRKTVEDEPRPLPVITSVASNVQTPAPTEPASPVPPTNEGEEQAPITPRKIQEPVYDDELVESESEDVTNINVQDQIQPTEQILPIETINVEISTPADFNDIYFEIATIKSPYSFQVGSVKNTRYVTVTSTMKKSFATAEPSSAISPTEPLTENILANTGAAYESTLPLDSSVATLPAITLESGQATPPLETITETFSTTQTLLKTHLLPVVVNGNTTRMTLVQTYNIARLVTATKTLPPMEIYQFIPSKTLNEFNSKLDEAGSELHLELDFGDEDEKGDDDDIPKRVVVPNSSDLDGELDPALKSVTPSKVKEVVPTKAPEQPDPQRLALLNHFGLSPQVITTSRPVVVYETVYESHVIPILNNGNTVFSTLSRPIGTVPRTSYEYGTSTITPQLPVNPIPQVPQLPQQPLPFFPQQQPQYTVTSAPIVTQTLATISDSKVLKLTFGAKTAYTTLYSTKVVPTELTTYVTTTIPVQPTVPAFPGYFPQPVGYPFPYVG